MSVGIQPNKESVDQAVGLISRNINSMLEFAESFKFWLDQYDATALQAAPFNYSSTEAALLKSVVADLAQLASLYRGGGTLAEAKDFRAFAKQVYGFGFTL